MVVSTLNQLYVGATETVDDSPVALGDDLIAVVRGFGIATLQSGGLLLSVLPGVELVDDVALAEETTLRTALHQHYTPLSAFTLLVFILLYVSCVATLAAIYHEFGRSWAITSAVYQTAVAWLVAFLVFQVGHLLGF